MALPRLDPGCSRGAGGGARSVGIFERADGTGRGIYRGTVTPMDESDLARHLARQTTLSIDKFVALSANHPFQQFQISRGGMVIGTQTAYNGSPVSRSEIGCEISPAWLK